MRYIINYGFVKDQGQPCRLTTFTGVDADSPQEAREQFLAAHPDRDVVRVIEGTPHNCEIYGMGAMTDEEQAAHKARFADQMDERNAAAREVREYVATYEPDEFAARIAYQDRRASEETQNAEGVHLGDLFSCEWGYDQTNVNFYQVVALKGAHTIVVQELNTRRREVLDTMTGYARPIRDNFRNDKTYTLRTRILHDTLDINAPEEHGTLRREEDGVIRDFSSYA